MTTTVSQRVIDARAMRARGFNPVAGNGIRKGDLIRADLPMSVTKAMEYVAERDGDHKGFDCVHWRYEPLEGRSSHIDNPHLLPWAPPFLWWKRCKARHQYDGVLPHHGRCGLRKGHEGDHALERGLDTPRWSTEWTA